jgi:hypothetical protein
VTRYVVEPRGRGYVIVDRESGSIITAVVSREEARFVVWDKNGRHGATPRTAFARAALAALKEPTDG